MYFLLSRLLMAAGLIIEIQKPSNSTDLFNSCTAYFPLQVTRSNLAASERISRISALGSPKYWTLLVYLCFLFFIAPGGEISEHPVCMQPMTLEWPAKEWNPCFALLHIQNNSRKHLQDSSLLSAQGSWPVLTRNHQSWGMNLWCCLQ